MNFTVEPVFRTRTRGVGKSPGLQIRMIRAIKNHLSSRLWKSGLTVLWDHDHDPEADGTPEEPALYTGPKKRSLGRGCRNGAVDVMVRDESAKTVPLLVEIEPDLEPKGLWGDIGVVVDSDRHVPSHAYCDDLTGGYMLDGTLLIIVTLCTTTKLQQLQSIARRACERLGTPNHSMRDVKICTGETEEAALADFERIVNEQFIMRQLLSTPPANQL